MKIKNLVGFLLVVILLATGTTPVIANEVGQCGSVEPIRPGDSVTDAVADVPAAHIDITEIETSLSGERLTVVFHLRDLPETLRFNQTEHGQGSKEYEWEVAIDADNDRSTGPGGFDTLLSAYHIAFLSHEGTDADTIAPIGEMLEASVWEIGADGSTSTFAEADLAVSAEEETITISGYIPGITSESRLTFSAYDVQFPGDADQIECHDPYSESVEPWGWGCGSGAALTGPGQTVTDEIEGDTPSYVDITKVSTSLSGETLTAVFHLRDVPETLTFNRTGISENYMEYGWDVSIDVDGDRETGNGGIEYELSASHFVPPSEEGSNAKASIESEVEADVLKALSDGFMFLIDATLEVSPEEDTITLSGNIPGITAESQLAFRAYDYFGGSDGAGCPATPGQSAPPSQGTPQPAEGLQACQEEMVLSQGEGCRVSGSATRVVVGSTSACLAFFDPALLLVCHAAQIDSSTVLSASRVGDSSWIIDDLAAEPASCGELLEVHDAVRLGRADWVSCLASTDVELNACDDEFTTPLQIAVEKGSSELVQILVAAGVDVNVLDGFGKSPLDIALSNDDAEVVAILVDAGAEGGGSPCLQAEAPVEIDEETELLLGLLSMYVLFEESGKSGELDAVITEMSQEFVSSLSEAFSEEGLDVEAQALGDTSLNIVIGEIVQISVKYLLPVLAAEGVDTGSEDEVTEFLLADMSGDADIEAGIAELRSIGFFDDTTGNAISAFVHNFPAGLARIIVAASAGVAVEDPIKIFSQSLVADYAGILASAGSEVDPAALGETPLQDALEYMTSEALRVFLTERNIQTLIASSGYEDDKALLQSVGMVQDGGLERDFRIWGDAPLFDALEQGDHELVRLLVEAGADVNAAEGFGGNTPLHEAVEQGDVEMVKILVAAGADAHAEGFMSRTPLSLAAEEGAAEIMQILLGSDPDADTPGSGEDKETPTQSASGSEAPARPPARPPQAPTQSAIGSEALYAAIEKGDVEMVRLLVEGGADVNAAEGFGGNTPLHEAVEQGDAEMVKILVAAGADVNAEGYFNRTPLSLAAEEGATEIMQILLGSGSDADTPSGGEDKEAASTPSIGSEALYTAIEKGDVEMVRLLVEAGADVNAAEGFGGDTPLHEAVEQGDAEIVKILVAAGADVNAEGYFDRTPLSLAAEEGATEIMQILLGSGPDADTPADGEDKEAASTPSIGSEALYTAIEKGDVEMVRLLVEAGADVNASEGFGGDTPLHEAVEQGNAQIVKILVAAGADVNAEGYFDRTPLSLAAAEGATEIMQILLGSGPDADTPADGEDKEAASTPSIGSEALYTAIEKGDVEMVRLLVEGGADVNAAEGFGGNTPLHEAVKKGDVEMVKILVAAGANIEAKGYFDRTPLSLAAAEGATEIMRILLGLDESTDTSEN